MDIKGTIALAVTGLFLLVSLLHLFRRPLGFFLRLCANTAVGFLALWLVRSTSAFTGIALGLNLFNALCIGLLGAPGLLLLVLSHWVLG